MIYSGDLSPLIGEPFIGERSVGETVCRLKTRMQRVPLLYTELFELFSIVSYYF